MRKIRKVVLALAVSTLVVSSTGCSLPFAKVKKNTAKTEQKAASEYVTLGEYKTVALKTKDIDKEVQSKIDQTLDQYATYDKVKTGKVKKGDTVNIYYVGKKDGKKFEGGSLTKKDSKEGYNLTIGSGSFIPGFEDGLIGKKIGTTVKLPVTFPKEYKNNEELAGKKVEFTVTLNYKQGKKNTPKLDEKFVKKNLTSYKSVADYKDTLRTEEIKTLAWEKVYGDSKVNEYPKDQVKSMYNQLNTSINYYLAQNNYKLSDYLSAQNITSDDFKKQLNDTAKEDVGKQLVYTAIAEKEKMSVLDKDYQSALKEYLSTYNCEDEKALNKIFKNYYGTTAKEIITQDLMLKDIKEYLAGNVKES